MATAFNRAKSRAEASNAASRPCPAALPTYGREMKDSEAPTNSMVLIVKRLE